MFKILNFAMIVRTFPPLNFEKHVDVGLGSTINSEHIKWTCKFVGQASNPSMDITFSCVVFPSDPTIFPLDRPRVVSPLAFKDFKILDYKIHSTNFRLNMSKG